MQENNQTDSHAADKPEDRKPRKWLLILGLILGLAICVFMLWRIARYLDKNISDPVQFVTGNLLNALIFAAIVAQVLIYRKQRDIMRDQWQAMHDQFMLTALGLKHQVSAHDVELKNMELQGDATVGQLEAMREQVDLGRGQLAAMQGQLAAMERQETAMRDQAKIMGDSLIIGQRSYVGIAELGDFLSSRVVIKIENRGGVPAEGVKLRLDALGGIREAYINENARRTFRKPLSSDYGRAKLFRGSLPFTYSVVLKDFLSDQEIALIREGKGIFGLRGHIDYLDGFDTNNYQRTEFSYLWLGGVWHAIAPDFWDTRVPESGTAEEDDESRGENPN